MFLVAILSISSLTSAQPFPFHLDILVDEDEAERIYNITNEFFNSTRLGVWASMDISPVTFVVNTKNETPGIYSFTEKNSSSSSYIDMKRNPSDLLCILAKSIGVAYIRTRPGRSSICRPSIRIRPSVTEYMDIAHQIYKYNDSEFTSVIYITDHMYDFDLSIFQKRFNSTLKMMMFTIQNSSVPSQIKQFVTDGNTDSFIMFASGAIIRNLLQILSNLKNLTVTRTDNWVMIPSDETECPDILGLNFSVVCLRHDFVKDTDVTVDLRYVDDALLLRSLHLLEKNIKALSLPSVPTETSALRHLAWHVYNATKEIKLDDDLMRIDKIRTKAKIGTWTRSTDVVLITQPFAFTHASLLTVITIHEPPFVVKVVNKSGTFFRGYTIDVLDKIAEEVGFTYVIREARDNLYGLALPDGSWTGLIGEVQRGEADLAAAPVSVTAEREQVIDFTNPYYDYAGLQILMSGTIASSSMFGFVDVFDGPVWLAWFGFLGLTGIMLYVFHILVYRVFSKEKEKDKDKVFTISDTLWFLISSITIYGPDKTPGTFAGRVLVIGFWFFCQIMMATYTANLAAFMTSKRLTTEIHSINELASQNSIKYSALAGSVSEAYFSRMKGIEENFFELWKNMSYAKSNDRNDLTVWDYPLDDLYSRMFSQINETGFLKTSKEGVDRVLSEGFAFIHETPMIKYEMTKYCNLITVGEVFSAKPYAFVLQENSPLKDAFNA
ncbi:ionotropic receptor 25a-like, partial [Saccostrea cucullata]|uniref:ionotropic receptor 25a-like n=1 Tax=Saccostrea cuccullata TaxID=36930 RepID=UPI002ED34860